jgi:hypothetical protein
VHYRALFQELLEVRDPPPRVIPRRPVSVS